ncbi:MAG: sterol desaturase family protein [Planctomycetota bacterium]|nr:sterol desaturase family protein [Planctomycetota bacterium]
MFGITWLPELLAVAAVFFIADLVYVIDHYLVHHDRDRYRRTHFRHHRRYNGPKSGPQFDAYELGTYNSAGFGLLLCMSVVTLFSGNIGFLLGGGLKWVHSLLFHLYQHGWWGPVAVRQAPPPRPRRTWGLASARYHAWHHSNPDDGRFTYAESWAGFDRILEILHPRLVRYTVDGRLGRLGQQAVRGAEERARRARHEARP